MRVLAIDPGTEQSGWCVYDGENVLQFGVDLNEDLEHKMRSLHISATHATIERVRSYGKAVGMDVFETVYWTGRFAALWDRQSETVMSRVFRADIKKHICMSAASKDPEVRQAVIDLFPRTGGGVVPQIGIKKQPGPLYGITSHVWAALALAIYWWEVIQCPEQ